jgi:hypothetical protein
VPVSTRNSSWLVPQRSHPPSASITESRKAAPKANG